MAYGVLIIFYILYFIFNLILIVLVLVLVLVQCRWVVKVTLLVSECG